MSFYLFMIIIIIIIITYVWPTHCAFLEKSRTQGVKGGSDWSSQTCFNTTTLGSALTDLQGPYRSITLLSLLYKKNHNTNSLTHSLTFFYII